ncbi:glycerophosphodiester phosphodiesterase family protein [Tsuneonella sp. HG222]
MVLPDPDPDPAAARAGWLRDWAYAHRGLHSGGVAENSMSAFAAAIAAGMGIECDVQVTGDGRAMVFHDWELDRLTRETGPVAGLTAEQLARIGIGDGTDRIPTLRDVLGLVHGRVPLLVEIKSKKGRAPVPLCLAVKRDLEGYRGKVAVMSFDPRVSAWFRTYAPDVVRGLVVTEENARTLTGALRRRQFLHIAKPDFLAYDVRDLPSSFAARQRDRGMPVLTWTVSSRALHAVALEHADAPIAEGDGVAIEPYEQER